MKLNVKTISGGTYAIDVNETDKISDIKKIIQEKVALDPAQQRLVYSGKILADDKTVAEHKLTGGMTIQLILQLKGGL
ncbi:ubiquitin-NEDD8-like protein [Acrasis kona]|uniref:Nedd8 n=1 Tax=Acrasis kona TaxID=1008807 RepID=A0AAW2Z8N9_9EUKA